MTDYLFLVPDLDRLRMEIERLKETAKQIGEETRLAVTQSAETWHDNFGYEEGQRQYLVISGRIRELNNILHHAKIVEPPKSLKKVCVGTSVVFCDTETGKRTMLRIGSYLTWDDTSTSYHSPLAGAVMNARVGAKRKLPNGRLVKIEEIITSQA